MERALAGGDLGAIENEVKRGRVAFIFFKCPEVFKKASAVECGSLRGVYYISYLCRSSNCGETARDPEILRLRSLRPAVAFCIG